MSVCRSTRFFSGTRGGIQLLKAVKIELLNKRNQKIQSLMLQILDTSKEIKSYRVLCTFRSGLVNSESWYKEEFGKKQHLESQIK